MITCPVAAENIEDNLKVQWQHFTGKVDKKQNCLLQFLSGNYVQKLFTSVHFRLSYSQNNWVAFLKKHGVDQDSNGKTIDGVGDHQDQDSKNTVSRLSRDKRVSRDISLLSGRIRRS